MINVNNLSVHFGEKRIIDEISFVLTGGDILAVLGPNGRGKTTLLKAMLGLQQTCSGQVHAEGHIAYVPQQTQMLFTYDVLSVVSMGRARHLRWYQSPQKKDIDIAYACLDAVHLNHLAKRAFQHLSGGEKQLVCIARAIASESPIILLDEPTAALDLHNQNTVLQVLRHLAKEKNLTIVFTTHQPQHALHIADQTLMMYRNDAEIGATADMCVDEKLSRLYQLPIKTSTVVWQNKTVSGVIPIFD